MATIFVQIKVRDFAEWKKVFFSSSGLCAPIGELSHRIYRDASDPNKITAIYECNSLVNALKFARSSELKAAMMEAGVQGSPNVYFLNKP